jgi:hypothetical protein
MIRCHGWNKPSTGNLLKTRCNHFFLYTVPEG